MSFDASRLYELLPAVHRIRDHEQGGPLRALLEVLATESVALEESLEQLYDDQFVETAAPWALPYLGDLLGIEGLPSEPLTPRAEVANTLAYRRRKGTAHVLERLARDVTGLPARAVEFFQLLATTQQVNHPRPENRAFVSVRQALRLESLGGAFERLDGEVDLPHTADVRRIASGRGRYSLPNVGIFLWRVRAYRLSRTPAVPRASGDKKRFRFSPLGNDTPLYNLPVTEDDPATLAAPVNVPVPIGRRAMHAHPARFYGRSILVEVEGGDGPEPVDVDQVDVCDLSGWEGGAWQGPAAGRVSIDPVLGRLAFGTAQGEAPLVTFHYGFPADIGGGEYDRGAPADDVGRVVRVVRDPRPPGQVATPEVATIQEALDELGPQGGVVEIGDGGRYAAPATIDAGGRRITLRAADGVRPTVVLAAPLELTGGPDDAVSLDGLLLVGARVVVGGGVDALARVRIRHCTLVPGLALDAAGNAVSPGAPSLEVLAADAQVEVERSILGPVRAGLDARLVITDSVMDAGSQAGVAIAGLDGEDWGPATTLERCTVLGKLRVDALPLASDSLLLAVLAPGDPFAAPVETRRTQQGCVRFCYVPPGSRTPRRFQCVPAADGDDARVRPSPASTRYGSPRYAQLPPGTSPLVAAGAGDGSEMGAYHLLFLSLREAHLRARLAEYLRFGQESGVFFAS
ncbi:MAG TPA: hypothetical protein VEX86_04470 [Longimicrobium sp.]|nr:hypothetical protein [Longimicrobium sp.]